jgi:hypothetical protein
VKGFTPGHSILHQLNSTEEREEPYVEGKTDKEKNEIAADGKTKKCT